MSHIEIIAPGERVWDTSDFPFCRIDIRAATLASNLAVPLDHWEEDGLGNACGFACRFPSGLAVLVQELAHGVKHLGHTGPTIYVDASQFVSKGSNALLTEVIDVFKLSSTNLLWIQSEDLTDRAREICEVARKWRSSHPGV